MVTWNGTRGGTDSRERSCSVRWSTAARACRDIRSTSMVGVFSLGLGFLSDCDEGGLCDGWGGYGGRRVPLIHWGGTAVA